MRQPTQNRRTCQNPKGIKLVEPQWKRFHENGECCVDHSIYCAKAIPCCCVFHFTCFREGRQCLSNLINHSFFYLNRTASPSYGGKHVTYGALTSTSTKKQSTASNIKMSDNVLLTWLLAIFVGEPPK